MARIEREVREQEIDANGEHVTRQVVHEDETASTSVIAERLVGFIGGALLTLLTARFLLLLFGASRSSGFVDFIYGLSSPFVAPFNGIFSEPTYGNAHFDSATLVAIFIYAIIIAGIMKLVTMGNRHYHGRA